MRTKKHRENLSNLAKKKIGNKNPNWRGGRLTKKNGYIIVYSPLHPYASKDKYVLEHRLVMEKKIKRFLTPKEQVHHINGIVDDNRVKNLMLLDSHAEHMKIEDKLRLKNKKGQYIKKEKKDEQVS